MSPIDTTDLVPAAQSLQNDHWAKVEHSTEQWLASRRSPHTASTYRISIRHWINYCLANHVDPLAAKFGDVATWASNSPGAAGTRAHRLAAVSSWYRWLVRAGLASHNPVSGLLPEERPKPAPRHAPALSGQQLQQLQQAADLDTPRSSALVAVLFYTGLRVGTVIGAIVADLTMQHGVSGLAAIAKGGRRKFTPLMPPVWMRLMRYLQTRDLHGTALPALPGQVRPDRDAPLFATASERPMDRKEVRRGLKRLARRAGLPPQLIDALTPHSSKATYITLALEARVPAEDVQADVDHADVNTTLGYDRRRRDVSRSSAPRLLDLAPPPPLPGEDE